ncbi:MAG: SAM-dependent methyltransferase [Bacteroidetes bacterium]|nr:MAG: SAM-dependent methyltransferase [Bacteroidota bacterium]
MRSNCYTGYGNTGNQKYRDSKNMIVADGPIPDNLYIPSTSNLDYQFEINYLLARQKENRIYTDELVRNLPLISREHPHAAEWAIRKKSCDRLIRYLESKRNLLNILEVGCGNGWLSYQLSRIPGSKVIGSDINLTELEQAARVFDKNSKLKFFYGDIRTGILNDLKFDIIVFAASIQYFPSLPEIMKVSLQLLHPAGEIHIIDSKLYEPAEVEAARQRSRLYYEALGMPEMAGYYYHHCINELEPYPHRILRNPASFLNKFSRRDPFFWICANNV